MSFDLAVWYSSKKVSSAEAQGIYEHLAGGDDSMVEASENIKKFYTDIIAKYQALEDLEDEVVDDSIWSVTPELYPKYLILNLVHSTSMQPLNDIFELAGKYDLVCYDPQSSTVFAPSGPASNPKSNLIVRIIVLVLISLLFGFIKSLFK